MMETKSEMIRRLKHKRVKVYHKLLDRENHWHDLKEKIEKEDSDWNKTIVRVLTSRMRDISLSMEALVRQYDNITYEIFRLED